MPESERELLNASYRIPGLRRRFALNDQEQFPWMLPRKYYGKNQEPRPGVVTTVMLELYTWNDEVRIILFIHQLKKDGTPYVNHEDLIAEPDAEGLPQWVTDEWCRLSAYVAALSEAIRIVSERHLSADVLDGEL